MRVCAHCKREALGYAAINDTPLCHPDQGIDCYRLVTVYHHGYPCHTCADVRILWDADHTSRSLVGEARTFAAPNYIGNPGEFLASLRSQLED